VTNTSTEPSGSIGVAGACTAVAPPRLRAAENLRSFVRDTDWSHMTYRRQEILEAFVALASTRGYEAVTMRQIGERVRMKAPSIYRHFQGREEIVTEAYRWHFYRFATAVLVATDGTTDTRGFWRSLVSVHLRRQLQSPENDMWDVLMASDRIGGFLPAAARREYTDWLGLYDQMFAGAAIEFGCHSEDLEHFVRTVVKILDTANEWCRWDGSDVDLQRCVEQAIIISETLIQVAGRAAARSTVQEPG
jgi:AcrR family transcriptional regulator